MASKVKDVEKSPKVADFMRKIGKSFTVIATDVLEQENLIPQTRKQFKVYNEYFNEIKQKRNEKKDLIQSSRELNRTRIYDSSNKFMEKAWDELKSNPIYEQEKEDYFEDEEEKEVSSSDLNEAIKNSGKASATMIGRVGEYIITNMRISSNLQRSQNIKLLNSVTSGFKITNSYLDKIERNTSQLAAHMSNSQVFYENMLSLQKQSLEIQMNMYETQAAIYNKNNYTPNSAIDRVYGKGYFDFGEYIKEVGSNLANMLSKNSLTKNLANNIIDPVLSTDLNKLKTNPIETILSLSARLAIRNSSTIKNFTDTLSEKIENFIPNFLEGFSNLNSSNNPIAKWFRKLPFIKKLLSNPMAGPILSIFGLKTEEKKDIDPSKFDKGPVPFDGVTRRTIIKVIPEYLARIESALTGSEERYMDNISGKWITKSKVKERNQAFSDTGFDMATKNMRKIVEQYVQSMVGNGVPLDQNIKDVITEYFRKKYEKGKISNRDIASRNDKDLYKLILNKGLTAEQAEAIYAALSSEYIQSGARSFILESDKAKNYQSKLNANAESRGDGIETMARGGRVRGNRGQPTLAIMTAGEKVVNTFGPRQTAINAANEAAYARSLGFDVPMYAEGTGSKFGNIKNFVSTAYGKVKEKGSELLETLKSSDMTDLVMELAPNANRDKVQTVLNKTATAIPRGLKGAGIGGLIGFFTGMPLIGMAVGSGVGLASVSDTVKGYLFGKEMEDGTYKPGVVPKSWTDFAKKALPNAKIGGIIGGIAGLLTGGIGILPAAVIGAGTGVALSSNKVKDFLFGKTNENGEFEDTGIIKKKVQDYIKKKAPGMGIGAVAGAVATLFGAGPFGLLGNAVLGAGTSLIVTSDKFKDFMLGKEDENGKRTGGLLGDLKLRFVDPLANAAKELVEKGKEFFKANVFDNITKFMKTAGGMITNLIADAKEFIANRFNNGSVPIDETIGSYTRGAINFGKKVLSAPVKLAAGAATLPFRALGAISNRLTDRMVSTGNASQMTAQERLNYRRTRKGKLGRYSDRYAEADKILSQASLEQLEALSKKSVLGSPNIEGFTEETSKVVHEFVNYVLAKGYNIKERDIRTLQKDIATANIKSFYNHLNAINREDFSEAQKQELLDHIGENGQRFKDKLNYLADLREKQENLRKDQSVALRGIKSAFNIRGRFNRIGLNRLQRYANREIEARKAQKAADEAKINFIDPNGNNFENAFRQTVSDKLNDLIGLLTGIGEDTTKLRQDATGVIDSGSVEEENGVFGSASDRFNSRNFRSFIRNRNKQNRQNRINTFKNHMRLGFAYGWGVSRNLMQDKKIDFANLDRGLISTLRGLNTKISSKDPKTVAKIIKSKYKDQLLEIIDIIKVKGRYELNRPAIGTIEKFIEDHREEYGNVLDYFDLVFNRGNYKISDYQDLKVLLGYDTSTMAGYETDTEGPDISDDGLTTLAQNLKYVKFTGKNADAGFVVEMTHRLLDQDAFEDKADNQRVNRFTGKLFKTGKRVKAGLTKAGKAVLMYGRNALFGKKEKSDDVNNIIDFVSNYGVFGGLKALVFGDENQKNKNGFLAKGGLMGLITKGSKKVKNFMFGDQEADASASMFKRHGLLGFIPAAIFGDDQKPGLLGNTLLGKGVKIFGKILKGLLIAAVAAPIVGQAVNFFKTTLKPVWATVIKPWWNKHITQPILNGWENVKKTLFGEKKKDPESGDETYEGGMFSGVLNKLKGPLDKIKGFLQSIKDWWNQQVEDTPADNRGKKGLGSILKHIFIGENDLITVNSDGSATSNGSILGNAVKWIRDGYKSLADNVVTPITGFFKNTVLPWIKNTAAPWVSGLFQTMWHNIFHKNDQWGYDSATLIALGGGNYQAPGSTREEDSVSYVPNTGLINNKTGEVITSDSDRNLYDKYSSSFGDISNGSNYKIEVGNNITIPLGDNSKVNLLTGYIDKKCRQVYLVDIKSSTSKVQSGIYYLDSKHSTYCAAIPLNKNNPYNTKNKNYFAKLIENKIYNGESVYYCVGTHKYYIITNGNLQEVDEELIQNKYSDTASASNTGGRSRNHIYQNDPRIRNTKFGRSTIGDAGCGPVAAANLMGGALDYATDYAQKGGFVNSDGSTSINYFSSMFNGRNTTSKEEVRDRLKSNRPVVLLGQDQSNGVYGSNNHFVTAKGYDKSGNIIVEDPDLPQSSMRYPASKVFKGMKAASLLGGKVRKDDKRLQNVGDNGEVSSESLSIANLNKAKSNAGSFTSSYMESRESGNALSSILSKFSNLASLIFKKTFGITMDDVMGSSSSGTYDSGTSLGGGEGLTAKTFTISGNQRTRFLGVAKSQVGYKEGKNNNTKYGSWYGMNNAAWCVMFVCWCAEKAGIPTSVIHRTASTTTMASWFRTNGRLYERTSGYIPLPGDIVFFSTDGSKSGMNHTGIVELVDGKTLVTIEGNYSDKVTRRQYANYTSNKKIYAFGVPDYQEDNRTIKVDGYDSNSVSHVEDSNGTVVYNENDEKQKIWKYMREKVGLNAVGTSGLFGAWENESGLKPKTIEGYYLKDFPGYNSLRNNEGLNRYTQYTLFPAYKKSNISINESAYLGSDGKNYYPGLGLAQWTGPRGEKLYKFARENGYSSIWDTDAQLAYIKSELGDRPNVISRLNASATPADAAKAALDGYEMYDGFADSHPDTLAPRVGSAYKYYDQYKGLGRNYREYRNPISYGPERVIERYTGRARESYVSYEEYLETIVNILIGISSNTDAVNKILEVLSSEGANLSAKAREEISKAASSTSSMQNLKDALRRNMSGQSIGTSSMISNSRTDLIIKTMKEIAAQ